MLDLYKRNATAIGGVFTSDKAICTFAGGSGSSAAVSALVQNIQSSYSQQVRPIYELGSSSVFRVIGRPEGRLTIGRIIGTAGGGVVTDDLYDACNTGGTMTIQAAASGCANINGKLTLTYSGIFVIDYGVNIAVEDLMIRENVTLAFASFNRTY